MKKTESITFRCSIELKELLEEIARKEDRSLSYIINKVIKESLLKNNQEGDTAADGN